MVAEPSDSIVGNPRTLIYTGDDRRTQTAALRSFHIMRNVKVTSTSRNGSETYHPIYFKLAYS